MIALDTNVLVYAAATNDDPRHTQALDVLDRLGATGAVLPLPVIGEFFNACRKKRIASPDIVSAKVGIWAIAFDCHAAILGDYQDAALLAEAHRLQYFDALIIAVAARVGATILLSEDMHDGLIIDGLTIINPFDPANDAVLAARLGSAL